MMEQGKKGGLSLETSLGPERAKRFKDDPSGLSASTYTT